MAPEFDQYAQDYEALQKDPIRRSFSSDGAFFYERKWDLIRAFFKSLGRDLRNLSWLDIGCGRGDLLRLGRSQFASVSGCDVSAGMLNLCADITTRPMPDPVSLPFADASFDFLTAVCVYHHVAPGQRAALTREAARVLRRDGIFAVIEHNPVNPATRLIVRRLPMDRNAILLNARETRHLLEEAGLAAIDTRYFLYLPEGAYRIFPGFEAALKRIPLGGQYAVFGQKR
ncbi:MAG TPA: class I SAM-dependent methyltransferase [Bryobacteraceae bacterium]|nr:class I SAM-dependent methyltransferase [Bryobacteraceae bacterium]